jgi:hypothetical protein
MPLWAVLAVVVAAYGIRSASRGFDFSPDLPGDAMVLVILLVVLALVGWLMADDKRRDALESEDVVDAEDPES